MLPIALLLLLQAAPAPAPAPAPQDTTPSDSGDPPGRVARLSLLEGSVSFQPSGGSGASSWSDAAINYALTSGDRLYADQGGRAELEVGDCTLRLNGVADLVVSTLTDDFLQVSLSQGTLRVSVYDLSGGDSIEVDTPNGALFLRRPGAYRIDVSEDAGTTTVSVDSGMVDVVAGQAIQSLRGGNALRLTGTEPIRVASVSFPAADDFDRWSALRDRPLASSVSAQYVGRDVPGYDDLDRSGQWESDADYGPVWYPTVAAVGWAPYRYGHWVWIDPWGWTWVDDASWGFVPFHYGRWVYVHSRWGWVPGRHVPHPCYAPALVVFVGVGTGGVQAWFPLGPREPYHPWYHHGPQYRERVNPYITPVRIRDVHYVNRPELTAVPVSAFQRGEPVARRTVPVSGDEVNRAEPMAHPRVSPRPQAATSGRPAARPPAAPRPVIQVAPWERQIQPRPLPSPAPVAPSHREPSRVIARNPPAPQTLPFKTRERAMQADPGRPLEPQQRQNLREGKPAGPHRDPEDPAHSRPMQPAPKAPAPKPQPAPKKP
ncbi:MAG TPA: DUF6600 domain-containing protein [Gemmatimonadales bacterium]|nr:DUF6600 domain-containing protein [Gemmatimonadales bacterium]